MLIGRGDLEEVGGWRPVPRSVDRGLIDRVRRAGGLVYRTHPLGYVYHRRRTGHTWDPGLEYFLRGGGTQWSGLPRHREFGTVTDPAPARAVSAGTTAVGEMAGVAASGAVAGSGRGTDAVGPPNATGPDRPARVLPGGARRRAAGRSATGWRPSPYLVCATLAVVGAVALSLRQPWGADFGLHVAAVGRLRDDLLDPANPMVDSPEGGPYSTPYTVALALVARLTGIPVAVVLSAAGPVNLALLLYGLRRVVALFGSDRWTPVVALAFVPLLWGTDAPRWSGFPNLRGLPLILPYPGTLGLALLLLGWAALARALAAGTPGRWVPVGLLGGVLVLVHPFTALGAALGAFALSVPRLRRPAGPDLRVRRSASRWRWSSC